MRYLSTDGVRLGVNRYVCNRCETNDLVSVSIGDRSLSLRQRCGSKSLVSPRRFSDDATFADAHRSDSQSPDRQVIE